MTTPILRTKFYVPPVRPELVSRPRLIERLNAGLWQAAPAGPLLGARAPVGRFARRLTLISAPAGFGKTTLLIDWLRQIALPQDLDQPAVPALAWLSLDADDNDPARFFAYLVGALETAHPEVGADARALYASPQTPPLKSALTVLLNALVQLEIPTLLVLDDYHTVEHQAIHTAMTFFVEQLPPQVHLVIATRADPPLPLARMRSRRELCELRERDLRFSPQEASIFFREAMGLSLTAEDVHTLEQRTEGWISGLQMAALALQAGLAHPRALDADHVARFIAAFDGSHRHVIDYLAQEVLNQQPPEIQRFLCQTAVLDRLTAPLCDAVTGRTDSDAILATLEHGNLFVVPLDEQREWYRYHHLFDDFLTSYVQQHMSSQLADLHCWAAEWYEGQGLLEEALPHVLAARDIAWATRLLEQIALQVLMRGETTRLLHWLDALPQALIRDRLRLHLIYAETLFVAGQLAEAGDHLQAIEDQIAVGAADPDLGDLRAQIKAMRAYEALYLGDLAQGFAMAREAQREMASDNLILQSMITWIVGFAEYFGRDVAAAQETLRETLEQGQASGNILVTTLSIFITGYTQLLQGRLRQAQALYERGLRLTQATSSIVHTPWRSPHVPGVSLLYQGLAEVQRERNALEEAAITIGRCLELAEAWGNAEVLVDSYVVQARIRHALQDRPGAQEAIERAMQFVREDKVALLTARQVRAHQARLYIAWGESDPAVLQGAARWAAEHVPGEVATSFGDTHISLFVNWIEGSTLIRLHLARGEFEQALARVASLLRAAQAGGWHGIGIDLLSLRALALQGLQDTQRALEVLQQALDLAEPEGYVRSVIDAGPAMKALLRKAQARGLAPHTATPGRASQYVARLRRALGDDATPGEPPAPHEALVEPLSERERQVLGLIAEGLTNREIAERLYLAVSTIKTHINNLYAKLGVSKRTQAIARGRQLGLL
jgi:LuxR family maltose regulon positive regulatory protein